MVWAWVGVTVTLPVLVARFAADRMRPELFKDPGGLKLPFGEVLLLLVVLATLSLIALLYFSVYGLYVPSYEYDRVLL